ncbi:3,4-dihydroxy-2-butanone-4-phosphate synthase [Nocardia vaccinii]|uniref:3,4-dihydroxy-2-butanone-4-phosphate synthase n=1 Tax=Nocardia vaccinii TaxID=1822 RepID=UPI00082C3655|nr:3,4-dihydroxy-2-butanone-4-phosphate synthase [Nocardia vaccinii]
MTPAVPAEAVRTAVSALAAGGMIGMTDDADRENEGDLVTAEMAFLARHQGNRLWLITDDGTRRLATPLTLRLPG